MTKSLSERIAARMMKKKPSRGAQNRAAFLSLRGDIKQALEDGWPVKSVWETLHDEGRVSFSYQAFRGYTNRLIRSLSPGDEAAASDKARMKRTTSGAGGQSKPDPAPTASSFTFNPKPNKEELL